MDEAGRAEFDWAALVPLVIHPVKVAIIEALLWINQPVSAKQLSESFAADAHYPGLVSHHAQELIRLGVIEPAKTQQVPGKGAKEKFLFFPGTRAK